MIEFDFTNALVESSKADLITSLADYRFRLNNVISDQSYLLNESSLRLPLDSTIINTVKEITKNIDLNKLKYIFLIGIGGSNLGTKAIYNAIYGNGEKSYPQIIFLETTSNFEIQKAVDLINSQIYSVDEFVVNIVSKSGSTTETIAIAEIILEAIANKFTYFNSRVFITTDLNSNLEKIALKNQFNVLNIANKIGGRYSVFSAVGLLPLYFARINIDRLIDGAKTPLTSLKSNAENDHALYSAITKFQLQNKGLSILNNFIFNPRLEDFGKWLRQLFAESLGKEFDLNQRPLTKSVLPTVSIGSTDLHSMLQLYLGGEKNTFTYFIYAQDRDLDIKITSKSFFKELNLNLEQSSINTVMDAVLKGTKKAYSKRQMPFVDVKINRIDEFNLGNLMQLFMLETMYLAKLLNVNAFDQPNVEEYKIETKKILDSNN